MESTAFIKAAAVVTGKIKDLAITSGISSYEEEAKAREAVQKELTQLFAGLKNPTLPSAFKLRDVAQAGGYSVDPRTLNFLQIGESMWPY